MRGTLKRLTAAINTLLVYAATYTAPIAYAWGEGGGDDSGSGGGGGQESVPPELVAMVNKVLTLIQYLGVAVLIGGMIYTGIQLATADTPEEQARAKKRLGTILLAGAVMALAKPLIAWLTGLSLD